jgi:hypothetical protein
VTLFDDNIKKFHSEKNLLTFSLELDPDPHSSKRLDPDPHIMYADQKHWTKLSTNEFSVRI